MSIDQFLTLALVLCLGASSGSAKADETVPPKPALTLGTLFYSGAERSAIVSQRLGAASAPPSRNVTVSGIVRRQNGPSTVWLNDEALSLKPYSSNEVLWEGQRVRVGQTLDTGTRRLTDVVPLGAVTRKSPP